METRLLPFTPFVGEYTRYGTSGEALREKMSPVGTGHSGERRRLSDCGTEHSSEHSLSALRQSSALPLQVTCFRYRERKSVSFYTVGSWLAG